jgi:hypothetical protein
VIAFVAEAIVRRAAVRQRKQSSAPQEISRSRDALWAGVPLASDGAFVMRTRVDRCAARNVVSPA